MLPGTAAVGRNSTAAARRCRLRPRRSPYHARPRQAAGPSAPLVLVTSSRFGDILAASSTTLQREAAPPRRRPHPRGGGCVIATVSVASFVGRLGVGHIPAASATDLGSSSRVPTAVSADVMGISSMAAPTTEMPKWILEHRSHEKSQEKNFQVSKSEVASLAGRSASDGGGVLDVAATPSMRQPRSLCILTAMVAASSRAAAVSSAAATSSSRWARRHSGSHILSVIGHIPTASATSQCLLIHPSIFGYIQL